MRGTDAARLLDRVVTRDVARTQPGQVLYTPWCDGAGKVLDDGTVTRLDGEAFRVTSAEPNLRWFEDNALGLDVATADVSDSIAALALQGPASRAILGELCDADLARLKYFRMTAAKLRGVPVTITRTGYTGDLGYEIWMDAGDALAVWDALIAAGTPYGITPAGMLALDVARIEAGLMLLDVDYVPANKALIDGQTSSPYELDLAWAVDLDKAQFVGKPALAAEASRGPGVAVRRRSRSTGARSRRSSSRSGSRRACRPPRGGRAFRCTPAGSRRATRRAASGRRSSSSTSRSRTSGRAGRRRAPCSRWR